MVDKKQRGFTIIEVVLFVAISGLLAATLMVGWTASLNTQRYRDSVRSVQSFLQQQYSLVYNVENARDNGTKNLRCDASGVVDGGADSGTFRGSDDCLLLGRFIRLQNGTDLTVSAIVGLESTNGSNDLEAIRSTSPSVVSTDIGLSESRLTIPWGATILESGTPQDLVIAIIRSPLTGTAHTYIREGTSTELSGPTGMLSDPGATREEERDMCLDSGAPLSGERLAVVFRQKASSQSSVETEVGC